MSRTTIKELVKFTVDTYRSLSNDTQVNLLKDDTSHRNVPKLFCLSPGLLHTTEHSLLCNSKKDLKINVNEETISLQ